MTILFCQWSFTKSFEKLRLDTIHGKAHHGGIITARRFVWLQGDAKCGCALSPIVIIYGLISISTGNSVWKYSL